MNNTTRGRNDLLAWEAHKPDNFFTADANLQHVLRRYMGETAYAQAHDNLSRFGSESATIIDGCAKVEDRVGNHPRLERWSGLGERVEQVEFHPNHDQAGHLIWESGIMAMQGEAGRNVEQMGLYYLLAHNGEAGHMCSLACTSGLIRALQQAGDADLRARFLPPLLDPNYETKHHGAQFLTEVQGGSDVGANAVQAIPAEDGTWRLSGEKWFCSNINADQFLMTARATDADGTRGLGLFLVPRLLDDGSTNGFHIRRLKDKLGTRTLASAELDFQEAVAYAVGDVKQGFKTVVEWVLNTSRLMNAVACAGAMRRVYIEAGQYACHRQAFGQSIASFPMVQEAVADIMVEYYAGTASGFYLAHLLDQIETGRASADDQATYRMLVNINKYITSINGSHVVHRGIEVLGGNGAIESFSILPRLYRDMIVLESWEGTHNVLCVQVMRDIARYQVHKAFIASMTEQLNTVQAEELMPSVVVVRDALARMTQLLKTMQAQGNVYVQLHARRFVDLASYVAQGALLLAEAQWEYDQGIASVKADVIDYFVNKHLHVGYDPLTDDHYRERLERLMTAL
ncbi:MAG: acyl-CoA dehydrogenase family protein [Anaerolineae bacterium]